MPTKSETEQFFDLILLSEEDRETLMPYWEMARRELDITDSVLNYATHVHLPRLKNLEYTGTRLGIQAMIREFLDLFRFKSRLEKGEDVRGIYGVLPAIMTPYMSLKYAGGDDVYCAFPDLVLMKTMQEVFHHAHGLFAVAEANGFSYGARHCALNKLGIAGRMTGTVPDPTVMWSWGLVCDEATKVDEFLKNMRDGDWTSLITRLPHDTYNSEDDFLLPDRIKYLGENFQRNMEKAEQALGVHVTEEDTRHAIEDFQRYAVKVAKLASLNSMADPVPLKDTVISFERNAMAIPFNTGIGYLEDSIDALLKEVPEAIAEGKGIVPKGSPRIGCYYNPGPNAWFEDELNKNGVAVVFSVPNMKAGAQLEPLTTTDPFEQMAEQWLRLNFGMGCGADMRSWVEKVNIAKPDGMLVGFLDYDRWLGQIQKVGARIVEQETGVPTFYVEADFYDDRDYSEEALRTRIESICQILKIKKAQKDAEAKAAAMDE